jgi:hypothetical protein
MSSIFSNVPKYAGKWEVVSTSMLDAEDIAELEAMATLVKSTWGKSFVFVTKISHYQMFIPADTSVDLPVGSKVPITDIEVVTLHKEGEKDIQRAKVIERARI